MQPFLTRLGRKMSLVVLSAGLCSCLYYTHVSDTDVQRAILATGIIGSTPAEASEKLKSVKLKNGERLLVDPFDPQRMVMPAIVLNAARSGFTKWNVYAYVQFDSTRHASALKVYYSADNPL